MKQFALIVIVALSLTVPGQPACAMQQSIALGARVGTLGFGADVTVALNERVAIRGGAGFLGFDMDLTGRFGLADNRTANLAFPSVLYTAGAEVSSGLLRAGAGLLMRSGDPAYEITYGSGASISIGGGGYRQPEVRTLTTTLVSGSTAPYVLLGFGSNSTPGLSFLVDLGAVFHLDPRFDMTATGDAAVLNSSKFRNDLETERRQAEDDAGGFVNYWPIISVGLRYGLR